jgi:hypothetical protein
MPELKKEIYRIIDSFLVEAPDQSGNYRSLERLNQDRHLAADNLEKLFLAELQALKEEVVGKKKRCKKCSAYSRSYIKQCDDCIGYNAHRQHTIEAFEKRGI